MKFLFLFFTVLGLSSCVHNNAFRTELVKTNCMWGETKCDNSIIEHYLEYDLGFIEFTERGNLFNRDLMQQVLEHVQKESNDPKGVAVFVFIHGWKHNADYNDGNVKQFREFLSLAAENEVVGKRKVIGVYVGWRGRSSKIPLLKEVSYWNRKSVAEEIGAGGVTEVLSNLHHILVKNSAQATFQEGLHKNFYVIMGHSFGGAIVLSAMHDILLNSLIEANYAKDGIYSSHCEKIRRFADGLILLNPAIEANKAVILKEVAGHCQFADTQPKLMHVLSSDGDNATKLFFPFGQFVNLSTSTKPKKLIRNINGQSISLKELNLDLQTVGNIPQFRSSYLFFDKTNNKWQKNECRNSLDSCQVKKTKHQKNHILDAPSNPFSFIKTDKNFIQNHSDVFGCYVQSYITTIVLQTQSLDQQFQSKNTSNSEKSTARDLQGCSNKQGKFDFMRCYSSQIDNYDCGVPPS